MAARQLWPRQAGERSKSAKEQKRKNVMAITVFLEPGRSNTRGRGQMAELAPEGDCMIRIRTGLLGVAGLLLSLLPTVAAASVSKPTAEERAACMGDAMTLCIAAIPNRARIASCLASKMSQLSPRCRAQFDRAATGR
jgi:hypothetical protein